MTADPIDRVRRYHAALNAFDLAAVTDMFAEHAEYISPGLGTIIGRPAIVAAMRGHFAEYADQVSVDDDLRTTGRHQVRAEWRLTATATSTGHSYARCGSEVITFDASDRICRVEVIDR